MVTPRLLFTFTLLCVCLLSAGADGRARELAAVQSSDTTRGIELYEQGNIAAAVQQLKTASKRTPTDASAWQYLGLALKQQGDKKGAQKAFKQLLDLRVRALAEQTALSADERARRTRTYEAARTYFAAYAQLQSKDVPFLRDQAKALLFYYALFEAPPDAHAIYASGDKTIKRATVSYNPEPMFSQEAREHHMTGEVTLRMVFAADGTVQHIFVLKSLPRGLTSRAVEAARQVRFIPAMKDGQPVAQFATIVYNFNIY